ncbi:hypothetical protein PCI56_08325 [Plesiomonas shigelloides subsp. oncorhynchi]|nr:hypothetical protein [Plesiomonas shigelloides]
MEKMEIYRGNFDIEDYVESRVALTHVRSAGDHVFTFAPCANTAALLQMTVVISADDEDVSLQFSLLEGDYNRFWMRLPAEKQEHIWGCGEQMSYFDLRGRHFPLWTSEPGVGRHPHSEIKWKADVMGKAGVITITLTIRSRPLSPHANTAATLIPRPTPISISVSRPSTNCRYGLFLPKYSCALPIAI